jgi:hypothetical protein
MEKQEILERFCQLSTTVMEEKFKCQEPADCFCNEYNYRQNLNFQYSEKIMDFITKAVHEKLDQERQEDQVEKKTVNRYWEIRYAGVKGTYDTEIAPDIVTAVEHWAERRKYFAEGKRTVEARVKGSDEWSPCIFEIEKSIKITLVNR